MLGLSYADVGRLLLDVLGRIHAGGPACTQKLVRSFPVAQRKCSDDISYEVKADKSSPLMNRPCAEQDSHRLTWRDLGLKPEEWLAFLTQKKWLTPSKFSVEVEWFV